MNRLGLHAAIAALIHSDDVGSKSFRDCVHLAEAIMQLVESSVSVDIEVKGGMAEVIEKPDWVRVEIEDRDTLEAEVSPCVKCGSVDWTSLHAGFCEVCLKHGSSDLTEGEK